MRELSMRNGEVVDADPDDEDQDADTGVNTECSTDDEPVTTYEGTQSHATAHDDPECDPE